MVVGARGCCRGRAVVGVCTCWLLVPWATCLRVSSGCAEAALWATTVAVAIAHMATVPRGGKSVVLAVVNLEE
ncbi:hypothetical protein D8674_033660 [Pyrus ussuriensis x Pyrus communis]|uniref:Uncharacterized protein n=1 Tax=Pyrus ussuriensis x Pyrus communis TaxID=2448454 RepID=A0A5N5HM19_9ROSA|nr:hypothetical protein D8674_033660 [Pyrus ussuriensis x Pyrus communis]